MKFKILILSSEQFGYLTDTLKYCEYAANDFEITYVGWDYNRPKIELPGINVKYVSRKSNLLVRNFRLLKAFHKEIKSGYHLVFATYTRGISIVKFFNHHARFIVDVRSLCVNPKKLKRIVYDYFLKFEISIFQDVSVISEGVASKLKLKNYHLLPIGGECFTSDSKSFEKLSYLYVGTLQHRNILECVKGFHLYLMDFENKSSAPVFTIVGDSPGNELQEIRGYIQVNCLSDNIITAGAVPQNKLRPYFESANVGVSYIPLRSYYKYQPPTKTFEYLISGLPVIATSTYENINVVTENVGILIEDNAQSVFAGLKKLDEQRTKFNSNIIRMSHAQFTWEEVVKKEFTSLIEGLISEVKS